MTKICLFMHIQNVILFEIHSFTCKNLPIFRAFNGSRGVRENYFEYRGGPRKNFTSQGGPRKKITLRRKTTRPPPPILNDHSLIWLVFILKLQWNGGELNQQVDITLNNGSSLCILQKTQEEKLNSLKYDENDSISHL